MISLQALGIITPSTWRYHFYSVTLAAPKLLTFGNKNKKHCFSFCFPLT
jgi:hypothetical protein